MSEEKLTTEERLAREPAIRLDTRTVVGALLLAVAFTATMQITERLDQLLTGGTGFPLGNIFANAWWPPTVIYFGLTGAVLSALFNPIIALLSGTHALAWSFLFLNLVETVPEFFIFRWYLKNRGPLTFWGFGAIVACTDGLVQIFQAAVLSKGILQLSTELVIGSFFMHWGLGTLIGVPIGWYIYRGLSRAGVFE